MYASLTVRSLEDSMGAMEALRVDGSLTAHLSITQIYQPDVYTYQYDSVEKVYKSMLSLMSNLCI